MNTLQKIEALEQQFSALEAQIIALQIHLLGQILTDAAPWASHVTFDLADFSSAEVSDIDLTKIVPQYEKEPPAPLWIEEDPVLYQLGRISYVLSTLHYQHHTQHSPFITRRAGSANAVHLTLSTSPEAVTWLKRELCFRQAIDVDLVDAIAIQESQESLQQSTPETSLKSVKKTL